MVRKNDAKNPDYVPCSYCKGFFTAKFVASHEKNCFLNTPKNKGSLKSNRAMLAVDISNGKFQDVHTLILAPMRRDEHHILIRNDNLLLLYGQVMIQTMDIDRVSDIRYALKLLSRLLFKFRDLSDIMDANARHLLLPENFDLVLKSCKEISSFSGPREVGSPNVFLLMGYRLKNLCQCARGQALREGDDSTLEAMRRFLELYDTEWRIQSNNAKAVYEENKLNLPESLPTEEDVKLFRAYCVKEINALCKKYSAKGKFTAFDYRQLARVTVARALTFNARRGAETSKLTLKQWASAEDGCWKKGTEIAKLSDPVEKKLAERLNLCYVPGKKKRGKSGLVPILFTPELVKSIRILVDTDTRKLASIDEDSKYIFATSGRSRLKGWDVLQAITKQIEGLEKPQLLTPTRTRKYLATMLQLLDMSDAELTWVTNHMGHTKGTHMAWYRKESSTVELTKMAKVLTAVDEGEDMKKKKIDDLGNNSQQDVPAEVGNSTPNVIPADEEEEMDEIAVASNSREAVTGGNYLVIIL